MYPRPVWPAAVALAALVAIGCSKDPEVAKREFVRNGDAYIQQEKYAEAIVEYRNAVQQDPLYAEARTKLASAYMRVNDVDNAYPQAVRAADLLSGDVKAQIRAGELLLVAGRFDEAMARADRALALESKNVEALVLRANAMAHLNLVDAALGEAENAVGLDPDRSQSYAMLAALQALKGNRDEAEGAFKKAVETAPNAVSPRLAIAKFYWTTGRESEAEAQFKQALTIEPKNLTANRTLALFYVASGRTADAEPFLKTVAQVAPDGRGLLTLADYYLGRQMNADAKRVLEDAATNHPAVRDAATLKLAAMGFSAGDPASGRKLIDDVLTRSPNNVEALLALAEIQANAGQLDAAGATIDKAIRADPKSAAAKFFLGRLHEARFETKEAITAFADALKLNPSMGRAELELARLYLAQNRLDDAESFAKAAAGHIPGSVDAYMIFIRANISKRNAAVAEPPLRAMAKVMPKIPAVQVEVGRLELLKGNAAAARAAFDRAVALDPLSIEGLSGLIGIDLRENRQGAVRARLDALVKSAPKNPDILLLATKSYALLKDGPATERLARQTIDINANALEAYSVLGQLYIAQNRIDAAIKEFTVLAEKQPDAIGPQTVLGILLQMQGKTAEAKARYERALAIDSGAAVAANNLAGIYSDSGENLTMALQLAQTAKKAFPDHPSVNDTLGWIYQQKGLSSSAVGPFEEAVKKVPDNPKYRYHLGVAYAGAGDAVKARESLEKALALNANFDGAADARQALARLKN